MKSKYIFLTLLSVAILSCNKEGQGGTSIIKGQLKGQDHSSSKAEVTEVIITNGNSVEHGDYWLLNTPSTNNYFYVWYDNPTWVSNGNPNLAGRTGIKVTFNYSDSNTDIATNTANAITAVTNEFSISILNDILIITNTSLGDTPDADKMTSPFEISTDVQGQNNTLAEMNDLVGEKVYISYGDVEVWSDNVSTGPNGAFQYTNLTKGNYTVSVETKDTLTGLSIFIDYPTEISKNKSVVDLGELNVIY